MRAAAKIAPPQTAEWANAMVAELHHIEGDWTALGWSIGSASVLAKHAIFELFIPSHALSEANFFAKEKPMRKSTAIAAALCIAASLLFFAAPTFREAFQLSVIQWHGLMRAAFHTGYVYFDDGPDYAKLVEEAERNHDAEGLAFVALHGRYDRNRTKRLTDEAVSRDPRLTWIYAMMGTGWPQPEMNDRISKLEQFDRQNAIPHLMQASAAIENDFYTGKLESYIHDPAWLNAMAAAFASPKLDTYGNRMKDLDRRVALRYSIYDPHQLQYEYFLIAGGYPGMGVPNAYIKILLDSGDALAARGDYQGAEKQYQLAAHFGERVEASRPNPIAAFRNSAFAAVLLRGPDERLAALYAKQGNQIQAQHYADIAATDDTAWRKIARERPAFDGTPTESRNAKILGLAGIVLFLCIAIIPICAMVTIIKSRSIQLSKLKTDLLTRVLARCSVIGLLISTTALYFSYRPYADIVRNYLRDGNPDRLLRLGAFLDDLNYSQTPPTHQALYSLWSFPMYFWASVIVLCAIALLFVAARFFWQKRQALPA